MGWHLSQIVQGLEATGRLLGGLSLSRKGVRQEKKERREKNITDSRTPNKNVYTFERNVRFRSLLAARRA